MSEVNIKEGTISFTVQGETYHTWYKVIGNISLKRHQPPLVILHGGPGMSHDYLLPLSDLATLDPDTPIIFYDQLGSSRSTHLPAKDSSFWTIDLFISELENLLAHFAISGAYDLLGHSWGGVLAAEFVVRRQPRGLRRLVLSNPFASMQRRNAAVARLRETLPEDVRETMRMHELAGTTATSEYKQALHVFYAYFACRVNPFPAGLMYSLKQSQLAGSSVHRAMRKGDLGSDWDIVDRLHLIHVPTLLISAKYDYMTEEVVSPFFHNIDKVKWVKFAHSSHSPHYEERDRYMKTVHDFLHN